MHHKDDQNGWNAFFSVLFAALLVASMVFLYRRTGSLPTSIPLFDLALIILAVFRLTRLFVYDKITQFIRDWFVQRSLVLYDDGSVAVERVPYGYGLRHTIHDLLGCPWCAGIWITLFVLFFYFLTPFAWYIILMLAIGGVATLIQLMANMIGWRAESLKRGVESGTYGS